MSRNTIHIEQGRVGRDPELKYGKSGVAFLTLPICTSDSWRDKEGNWQSEKNWFDVKLFGRIAEETAADTRRGDEVYLRGHMKLETWEGERGKGSKHVIIPDIGHFRVIHKSSEEATAPKSQPGYQAPNDDDIPF